MELVRYLSTMRRKGASGDAGGLEQHAQRAVPPYQSSDVWIRDYGPTFLLHRETGKKAAVKWKFNAWGE